jgi:hypothetical protein
MARTYTPLRKALTKNPNILNGTNKTYEQFRMNTLNNTVCSRIEDSGIEEPANLVKKRCFLSELKASLATLKDSSSILRSEAHGISLYLKKSDMLLSEDVDFRTSCRIIEMEMPLLKIILRIARNCDTLTASLQETTEKYQKFSKDNAELQARIRHFEEITKAYNEPAKNQKAINTAKVIFTKFKEEEEHRSLEQQLDTSAKE